MNQILFFLPLVCLKGVNYKLGYLKKEVSHVGWERGQAASFFGSQAPRPRPEMTLPSFSKPSSYTEVQKQPCLT